MNEWPTKHRITCSKRIYVNGALLDWCHVHVFIRATRRSEAVEIARRKGWSTNELGRLLCPTHVGSAS